MKKFVPLPASRRRKKRRENISKKKEKKKKIEKKVVHSGEVQKEKLEGLRLKYRFSIQREKTNVKKSHEAGGPGKRSEVP